MIEFLALTTAHILADFYWQPTRWVLDKKEKSFRSKYLYLHVIVVFVVSYTLLGRWSDPLPAAVLALVHGVIDILKLELDKKGSTRWFVADQILHLISIIIITLILTSKIEIGIDQLKAWYRTPRNLAIISGVLLCLSPVSFLVGMLTRPWRDELEKLVPNADDNLANAGRWIGMSERLLIFVFVLINQFSAIGFLIAAKSLLRYNDKTTSSEIPPAYISKKSEYILVGTLMSYTCSITIALITKLVN